MRHVLQLERHEIQYLHLVQTSPPDLQIAGTWAAIVQKRQDFAPGDVRRCILVDVIFHENQPQNLNVHRYAHAVRKDMTRRVLLEELGIQPYCAAVRQRCIVRVNNRVIPLGSPVLFPISHGDYVRVDLPPHPRMQIPTRAIARCLRDGHRIQQVPRIYSNADTDFEWETVTNPDVTHDEDSMLQLPGQRTASRCLTAETVAHAQRPGLQPQQLSLEELIPKPSHTQVDFSAVQWFWYELQQIQLDVWEEWPADFALPEVTNDHLQLLMAPCTSCTEQPRMVHFFVDGSHIKDHVGAGVACLVETDGGTFLAGCLSKAVEGATFAFQGEHAAMTWALIWAIRISQWYLQEFGTKDVHFAFNFDAMNTGYQAAGYWRTRDHGHWRTLLRSMAQVLQQRHKHSHLHWNHIKAHSQHPFNELVDALAKYAATNFGQVEGSQSWLRWLHDPVALMYLQWLWYLEYLADSAPTVPAFHDMTLVHTKCHVPSYTDLTTQPAAQCQQPIDWSTIQINMKVATADVLTLSHDHKSRSTNCTKQRILQKQFHDEGCLVVGIQETRHRRIVDPNNEWYHIVGHAASSDGTDGIQMWFSKTIPIYEDGPRIVTQNITIVHSNPMCIIARVCMLHFRAIFVTCRAPHSGQTLEASEHFWAYISQTVRPYERDHLLFFLGDTNGHIGEHVTAAVGPHAGSRENHPGKVFHNWMLTHHLLAPSTMSSFHTGERSTTFCSPDGEHRTRIDFIAVPEFLHYDKLTTWVAEQIDLCGNREDHTAVMADIRFSKEVTFHPERRQTPMRIDRHELAQKLHDPAVLHQLADEIVEAPWALDPHQSADWLVDQVGRAIQRLVPHTYRWRRKRHIPNEIWQKVQQKKLAFRHLRTLKHTWRRTLTQAIFAAWRSQQSSSPLEQHQLRGWLRLHDHTFACTLREYKKLTVQVTADIRCADAHFYQQLAFESGHAYTHEGLTALWKRVKAVLPKNRMKQFHARYDIGEGLQQHFAELEAGEKMPDATAKQQCAQRNNQELEEHLMPQYVALHELPTLAEIEELCLRQQPHRAAGLDGLPPEICRHAAVVIAPFLHSVIMKAFVSGIEPYRYKGGLLVPIWKQKSSQQLPASYRGILLADVFGKVLHAWARKRLLPTLLQRRAPGQIGGLPSQQTITAIQLLRMHGKLGRARRLSTAAIFVDLKAAFHHMLREFIFTIREPATQAKLQRIFDPNEFDLQQLARELQEACETMSEDIPVALRTFLHDIHKKIHGSSWKRRRHHRR